MANIVFNQIYGLNQLADAFKAKIFTLNRNDYFIGSEQAVYGQEVQAGAEINDNKVIPIFYFIYKFAEIEFAFREVDEFN